MAEEENSEQHLSAGLHEIPLLPVPTSWLETPLIDPLTSTIQTTQAQSYGYSHFLSMLSSIDLELHPTPLLDVVPPPITTNVMSSEKDCSSRFEKGESSGMINKSVDQIPHMYSTQNDVINMVCNLRDNEAKRQQDHDARQPIRRRRRPSAELHNLAERRRRNLVAQRISALKALIPNCHKTDQASVVSDAIDYIKLLQQQLQMISMPPVPYFALFMPTLPMMGTGTGIYSSAIPSCFPVLPPSGESRFQPVSQLQFPFNTTITREAASSTVNTTTTVPSANETSQMDEEAQKSNLHDSTEGN